MQRVNPRVFVVDDDRFIRESLSDLIRSAGLTVQTFASAHEFLRSPRPDVPSCLVLDVQLPGVSGLELQQQLAAGQAPMPIIFITGHGDIPMTVRAMKAGAVEFLTKPVGDAVLLHAIRYALARSHTALGHEAELRGLRDRYASLSRREREVMALVVSGLLNKQVGFELGISEITVKAHRGQVMRKMQAASLAALVTMAARLRLAPGERETPEVTLPPAAQVVGTQDTIGGMSPPTPHSRPASGFAGADGHRVGSRPSATSYRSAC
jgi:FixJ family two-component response regulator